MQKNEKALCDEIKKAAVTTVKNLDPSPVYEAKPFVLKDIRDRAYGVQSLKPSDCALEEKSEKVGDWGFQILPPAGSGDWKLYPLPMGRCPSEKITQEDVDNLFLDDANVTIVSFRGRKYLVSSVVEAGKSWEFVRAYVVLGMLPSPFLDLPKSLPSGAYSLDSAILIEAWRLSLQLRSEQMEKELLIYNKTIDEKLK